MKDCEFNNEQEMLTLLSSPNTTGTVFLLDCIETYCKNNKDNKENAIEGLLAQRHRVSFD